MSHEQPFLRPLAFLKPLGPTRAEIPYSRRFNVEEAALFQTGLWPRTSDDHWIVLLKETSLNVWVRWSGNCIYSLPAERHVDGVSIGPLFVNVDPEQHYIPFTDPKQQGPFLEKFLPLHVQFLDCLIDGILYPDDSRSLSDAERRKLCTMISHAFVMIRSLGYTGKAERAADLADALHNLPSLMWEDQFSLRLFRAGLESYSAKHSDTYFLKMLDEMEATER